MILDPNLTIAYIVVAAALAIAPGPDVLFVVACGMRHKIKGAVASALGIACGSLFHAIGAAVGVSAIIAASSLVFNILTYAGAAYLAFLGLQAIRSWWLGAVGTNASADVAVEVSVWDVFKRGLITNILNPKVILFYLALLPQFVNVELGNVGLQIFLLGGIHNIIGVCFLLCVGIAAGKASGWLMNTRFGQWMDLVSGLFFVGLAARLLISERTV